MATPGHRCHQRDRPVHRHLLVRRTRAHRPTTGGQDHHHQKLRRAQLVVGAGPQDLVSRPDRQGRQRPVSRFRQIMAQIETAETRQTTPPEQRQHGLGVQERQPAEAGRRDRGGRPRRAGRPDQRGRGMEPVKTTGEEPQGRFHPHDHHAPEAHRRETADMVDEHGGQRQQRVFQRPPGQAEGRRYPRPYRVL